jgi:sulfide:quinone oxidoreductase
MTIPYDLLVVATGASPSAALRETFTFRGPADDERVASIVRRAGRGDVTRVTLAIPTSRTWPLPIYELAFGLRGITDTPITVATVEHAAGAVLGPAGSAYVTSLLRSRDIDLVTEVGFDRFTGDVTIAAPELRASRIHGIPADDDGFVPTNGYGAVVGVQGVYAAGDVTSSAVKHGSLAAGQADTVAETVAAAAGAAVAPTPFKPILRARIACGEESVYVRRDLEDPRDEGLVSRDPLWSPPAKIFAPYLAPALAGIARRHQRGMFSRP